MVNTVSEVVWLKKQDGTDIQFSLGGTGIRNWRISVDIAICFGGNERLPVVGRLSNRFFRVLLKRITLTYVFENFPTIIS